MEKNPTYLLFSNSDTIKTNTFITPWSLMHLICGGLCYIWLKFFIPNITFDMILFISLMGHTIYEKNDYIHAYIKQNSDNNTSKMNSLLNSIGDTVVFILLSLIHI